MIHGSLFFLFSYFLPLQCDNWHFFPRLLANRFIFKRGWSKRMLLPLDGMLIHHRLPPSILSPLPIYTPGWREQSVLPKNTTQWPRPELEPRPFDAESNALTIRPPRLPRFPCIDISSKKYKIARVFASPALMQKRETETKWVYSILLKISLYSPPKETKLLLTHLTSDPCPPPFRNLILLIDLAFAPAKLTLSLPESNLESINMVVTFKFVDETPVCNHSNESYCAVLSCGAVCFWQFWKMKFKIVHSVLNLALLGVKGLKRSQRCGVSLYQ